MSSVITPFTINVRQSVLDDLKQRLERTRWIDDLNEPGWVLGLDVDYLRSLVTYWRDEFDWRALETKVNAFAQFQTTIDGQQLHFIWERGHGADALPLILTHGFPDSFLRFLDIIPLLTDPAAHGGDASDAFDIVVPSLPGFGFSGKPSKPAMLFKVADLWQALMSQLGYRRFAAHGADWGSTITEFLARDHSESVIGIHLTDVPFFHAFRKPDDPTAAESKYLKHIEKFGQGEGAYAFIQGGQPQALALGLNDSPAGLAAWIVEKFRRWADCDGDVETCFTRDQLLANVTLYWVTQTINSSFIPYYEIAHAGATTWIGQKLKEWQGSSEVPAGFAMFPEDLSSPPPEWAERFFNVQRWTEMPRGGHFAAMEEPELLVKDIRDFFRPLRHREEALRVSLITGQAPPSTGST